MLLLFLPKFNIIELQAGGAGLRIDDGLLFFCFAIFISVLLYHSTTRVRRIELAFAGWILALLASNFVNVTIYGRSSYLYSLRFIEYFLFFYFGYYYAQGHELRSLAKAIIWINAPIMVLQTLGVIGGFASAGYSAHPDRALGLTGGPWEIGTLLNFCFAILIFEGKPSRKSVFRAFFITTALILLTGARMAMLAQLATVIAFYHHRGHNAFSVLWKSGLAVATVAALIWFTPNPLRERSQNLFDVQNFRYLEQMYERTPDNPSLDEFYDYESQGQDSDMSWVMRVSKWCVAVKLWTRDATNPVFGLGPGGIGVALDGGWLRIVIETGILGLVALLVMARTIWCISPTLRVMLLTIALTMLMIDIYLAYKVMALLFFAAGYFTFRNEKPSQRFSSAPSGKLLMVKM